MFLETVIHSSSVLSNLSSTWTQKPPLEVKYRMDTSALDQPGSSKSLSSSLDRLLAWEKKLYEEVKVSVVYPNRFSSFLVCFWFRKLEEELT